MSIFDKDIRLPMEDLFTKVRKVVCDTVTRSLIHYQADPDYLVKMIGWNLESEDLWANRNKPKEDQIYKKIFGIKVKKEGYKRGIPYYKVSLCWGPCTEFYNQDHINPEYSIDIYVGINGIIDEHI